MTISQESPNKNFSFYQILVHQYPLEGAMVSASMTISILILDLKISREIHNTFIDLITIFGPYNSISKITSICMKFSL